MPTLGEILREGRYRRDLSLEQVEADTKVRKKYLLALEEEDYSSLPAPVYARGYVRTYAEYLGIDPHFADKLFQPPERSVQTPAIRPAAPGISEIRHVSMGSVVAFVAGLIAIAAVVFLYAQYLSYVESSNLAMEPVPRATTVASPSPVAIVVVPTVTPTPIPPSPTPIRGVEVVVNVLERCWLRVAVDGRQAFEGELQAGQTRTWNAKDRLDMRVGNAGGVEVTVNGMRQGKLGASGEVKDVTWGRQ